MVRIHVLLLQLKSNSLNTLKRGYEVGSINENIFEIIDSKEKAYWIGFLYADGNVAKKGNRIGFNLSSKDVVLLEKFCDFIGGDRSRIVSYSGNTKTVFYYVYSKKMKEDLSKYSIVPDKTHKREFPIFHDMELFLAFFLGAYDGDGSEGTSNITSGNKEFLEYCCDKFEIEYNKIRKELNRYGSCFKLNIGCKNFIKVLLNYSNSLERKRRTTSEYFPSTPEIIFSTESINLSTCVDCGSVISRSSTRCSKCSSDLNNASRRKFEISKEELEALIKEKPMTEIGKIFGISDNGVRKRCKTFGIELKPMRGCWAKQKALKKDF
jgi:hypothetical protein